MHSDLFVHYAHSRDAELGRAARPADRPRYWIHVHASDEQPPHREDGGARGARSRSGGRGGRPALPRLRSG